MNKCIKKWGTVTITDDQILIDGFTFEWTRRQARRFTPDRPAIHTAGMAVLKESRKRARNTLWLERWSILKYHLRIA